MQAMLQSAQQQAQKQLLGQALHQPNVHSNALDQSQLKSFGNDFASYVGMPMGIHKDSGGEDRNSNPVQAGIGSILGGSSQTFKTMSDHRDGSEDSAKLAEQLMLQSNPLTQAHSQVAVKPQQQQQQQLLQLLQKQLQQQQSPKVRIRIARSTSSFPLSLESNDVYSYGRDVMRRVLSGASTSYPSDSSAAQV